MSHYWWTRWGQGSFRISITKVHYDWVQFDSFRFTFPQTQMGQAVSRSNKDTDCIQNFTLKKKKWQPPLGLNTTKICLRGSGFPPTHPLSQFTTSRSPVVNIFPFHEDSHHEKWNENHVNIALAKYYKLPCMKEISILVPMALKPLLLMHVKYANEM